MSVLHTRRLTLRPIRQEDAVDITALIGTFDVVRWLTLVPHPYTLADAEAFIAKHRGKSGVWVIALKDACVGIITIRAELGYWLGKPHWGQGFMTEAARAVVDDYFAQGGLTLLSGYHLGNTASAGVLSKLGFKPTQTRKARALSTDREVTIQGVALTRTDWEKTA